MRTPLNLLLPVMLGLVAVIAAPAAAYNYDTGVLAPRTGHWNQLGQQRHYGPRHYGPRHYGQRHQGQRYYGQRQYGHGRPAIHRYGYHQRPRVRGQRYAYPGHGFSGYSNRQYLGPKNPRYQPYFRGHGARRHHGNRFGNPPLHFRYRY